MLLLFESVLDSVQFGGKRNYGYGTIYLKETQGVDLEGLEYSTLEEADTHTHLLVLATPLVLESTSPSTDNWTVPSWWAQNRITLRERKKQIILDEHTHQLQTVDHGQIVEYTGDNPIETAKNGICRLKQTNRPQTHYPTSERE